MPANRECSRAGIALRNLEILPEGRVCQHDVIAVIPQRVGKAMTVGRPSRLSYRVAELHVGRTVSQSNHKRTCQLNVNVISVDAKEVRTSPPHSIRLARTLENLEIGLAQKTTRATGRIDDFVIDVNAHHLRRDRHNA